MKTETKKITIAMILTILIVTTIVYSEYLSRQEFWKQSYLSRSCDSWNFVVKYEITGEGQEIEHYFCEGRKIGTFERDIVEICYSEEEQIVRECETYFGGRYIAGVIK